MTRFLLAPLTVAVLLTAAVLFAAPAFAETIDNPQYTPWAKFNPGASVTQATTSEVAGTKSKTETTTTLKSKSKDKLVLSTVSVTIMTIPGQGEKRFPTPAQESEIPAKIEKPVLPKGVELPKTETTKGEETLKVVDTDVKCTWAESTIKNAQGTTKSKIWMSDDMPGGMVKMTLTMSGTTAMKTDMVVTAFKKP